VTTIPAVVGRRWPRRAAYAGVAGLAVLLPTGTAGASWFMASQVLNVEAARQYPVRVRSASGNRVTLARTPETARSIPLAFVWPGGHAELGPVVSADKTAVVREVTRITRGALQAGLKGYTSAFVFGGDPRTSRGIDFEDVEVPTPLGPMPAWFVPGTSDVWVVAVHGRGAPRGEVLRVLPTLVTAGHPTLAVTYRNDEGAPASPDRMFHLGDTEWEDVDAAIRFARSRGAKGIILYGWSMGGATALTVQRRRADDGLVQAMILDCPVIDWTATLQMNARALAVPAAWAWTAMRLLERRIRVRLSDLDHRVYAGQLSVPTLLIVDQDDATVAPWPSVEFAQARPDLVTLVETRGAGHCRSWNLDPASYEAAVTGFLASL
jgi:pimeloyl-ACP methyl ester carboxylesterase